MLKPFSRIAVFAFVFCALAAAAVAQQRFVAVLSGAQQVPPNNSAAAGKCALLLSAAAGSMNLNCLYQALNGAQSMSLHIGGSVGENVPSRISIPITGPNGAFSSNLNGLTPADIADLRSNRWYLNFSSASFPNGEIRGQAKLANGTYNDYDGDGRTDLQVYRTSDRTFYARRSIDGGLLAQPLGQQGDSVSLTVDFDGDGISDFSTARYSSEALWRVIKSTTGALEETQWGSSSLGDFFAAADYDGDGAFDIAVFRAGVWYIIESSTGTYRYEYWGQSGDVPAPNDFDNDGKTDLAIARSESGSRVWHIRYSSTGQWVAIPWGLSSDAFFTGRADYDGDGAQDISVIRNEAGGRVFYIRQSSDGQLRVVRWGLSSDLPKLSDYDGDGKTDLAVTRAENGGKTWYILQSSNGQPRYEFFGLPGDF